MQPANSLNTSGLQMKVQTSLTSILHDGSVKTDNQNDKVSPTLPQSADLPKEHSNLQ